MSFINSKQIREADLLIREHDSIHQDYMYGKYEYQYKSSMNIAFSNNKILLFKYSNSNFEMIKSKSLNEKYYITDISTGQGLPTIGAEIMDISNKNLLYFENYNKSKNVYVINYDNAINKDTKDKTYTVNVSKLLNLDHTNILTLSSNKTCVVITDQKQIHILNNDDNSKTVYDYIDKYAFIRDYKNKEFKLQNLSNDYYYKFYYNNMASSDLESEIFRMLPQNIQVSDNNESSKIYIYYESTGLIKGIEVDERMLNVIHKKIDNTEMKFYPLVYDWFDIRNILNNRNKKLHALDLYTDYRNENNNGIVLFSRYIYSK